MLHASAFIGGRYAAWFDTCCCTDGEDSNQINFLATTDEGLRAVTTATGYGPPPAAAGEGGAYTNAASAVFDGGAATVVGVTAGADGGASSSGKNAFGTPSPSRRGKLLATSSPGAAESPGAKPMTAEERQLEKVRLQSLVSAFAKKAVKGCPCTYFKERSSEKFATTYRIDKSLEYLIVVGENFSGKPLVTCPIATIQDVYSLAEDGEQCFPPDVASRLSPHEQQRLLMVVYQIGEAKTFRFCLLEESVESRDTFLECLRILCIYAQSAPTVFDKSLAPESCS